MNLSGRLNVISRKTIERLILASALLSLLDVLQSYYLQEVLLNAYSEVNTLPRWFFTHGLIGYLAYWPIEILPTFAILFVVWFFASTIFYDKKNL